MARYEDGKKPIYKKVWFWILVIIALIFSIMFNEQMKKIEYIAPISQKDVAIDKKYAINEEIAVENIAFCINSIEVKKNNEWISPNEGKEFILVNITIKNIDNININYDINNFVLENSHGQIIEQQILVEGVKDFLKSGELVSGGYVNGNIVFEVNKNETPLILHYRELHVLRDEIDIKIDLR